MAQRPGTDGGPRPYFPELDGVRAIAALMVMVFHFQQIFHPVSVLIFGQTGVDLFFVLSGFLITNILMKAQHGDWHEVRNFYIRRTLRIFPLYYGYLLLSCLVVGVVSGWYWVYLQNIAESFHLGLAGPEHFWSLAVEEQFYLVWPFLILFWPRRWLAGSMWGVVLVAVSLRVALVHSTVGLFTFTPTRLDGLAGGGLLAFYYARGSLHRYRHLLTWIGAGALVSLVAEKIASHGTGLAWVEVVKYTSAGALYVSIIGLLIITRDGPVHRVLECRPLRELGRVSYGLYVYHPLLFMLLAPHLRGLPLMLRAVILFMMAYLVALASFYGFEKRFTNLKERLTRGGTVPNFVPRVREDTPV